MPKSKSRKAKAKKPAKSKKTPIPPGFRTVTPYLAINGAAAAIDWYKKAFGAKELARQAVPDGKLMHARIRIGDSIVMLSDTFPGGTQSPDALGNSPVTLHIHQQRGQAMESSCRRRRQGDHAIRQHVLGRTLRPTNRPLRSPLVSITASQHDKERERREAETSHGNVRSGPTFRSDRRTANRTTVTSA